MTRQIWKVVVVLACLLGMPAAHAEFRDIKIDLTNGNLLESDEIANKTFVEFGAAVAADGTVSRVASGDATAAITLKGKYHSDEHGWGNFSSTVDVEGPVKISMGSCAYGGDATVKNAAGETVGTFNINIGKCFHQNKAENIVSTIYKGGAATLTISGGGYASYIAVEAVDPSQLVEDFTVSYGLGDTGALATILPANETVEKGATFVIPKNMTVYSEGKTLTGWTDGTNTYAIGDEVTVNSDITLTPVFTDNAASLADRTEPLTLRWDFQRRNGAPSTGGIQNQDGLVWVTQAEIGGVTIDVPLPFSTTNDGKFANAAWTDWAQLNPGTSFQVPSCKGAVISLESYGATTTTTIDGQVINQGVTTPSFTCGSATDPVEVVIGDGSYFRYIQVVLPVVAAPNPGGARFENEAASIVWPFNGELSEAEVVPDGAIGTSALSWGSNLSHYTAKTISWDGKTFTCFGPAAKDGGARDENAVTWFVKPKKGVTFTPTHVSANILRVGTGGGKLDIKARDAKGNEQTLATGLIPGRNKANEANPNYDFSYDIPASLATDEGFYLTINIYSLDAGKQVGFNNLRLTGIVDGQVQEVEMYALSLAASPAEGGSVSAYPNAAEYEAGTEVKLTAAKNFGYAFTNWTDASGAVVSEEAEFTYTMTANAGLTANFAKLTTYELSLGVSGGANAYQVQPVPAGTMVDGKRMYEEGTQVTVTATSNPVVTFASWDDGQTSSEVKLTMDADKALTANFDAADFIAGWDFMEAGNNGRVADFCAADNDAAALNLRNAAGDIQGWLDKSQFAAGGYEGRPAAVNWRTTGIGDYYWQTMVNAEAFTDIKVITAMALNYNAYSKQDVEYSLDGETWTKVGTVSIPGTKNWVDATFSLPAAANNQPQLFIRWISDKTSEKIGTASDNDGIALGASFIVGTARLVDDGTAPVLVSQVPEEGSTTASINGKIVLTFDEKVMVSEGAKATLGDLELEPAVTGKTVMFNYKNLAYGTPYKFTLPAGSVADLTGNAMTEPVVINFTTKTRPAVDKALYDAYASSSDELVQAITAANTRADKTKRFRIFIYNGEYKLPASATATKTGTDGVAYSDPTTYVTAPNISFIGESRDGVVVTNIVPDKLVSTDYGPQNPLEGIGKGDVLRLEKTATGCYFQNLTIKSAMGDKHGRDIEVNDNSDKTIMKDVCLWGYQDTYVSNNENGRFYFEGGVLRGRTDFLCGKGDVFYNAVTLQMVGAGYLAVPSKPKQYGYIFKDCEIVGENDKADGGTNPDGKFTLGRPWGQGTPIALFIDTKMTVRPSAVGWNEMGDGWPARFAEYNSTTASGTVIDLKDRKSSLKGHANNPSLTKAEAEAHSLAVVMGGDDDWDPATHAEQAPAPSNVVIDNGVISWDDCDYASLWAVCADGRIVAFTTEPAFDVTPLNRSAAVYTVRAANEMGGLGEAVEAQTPSALIPVEVEADEADAVFYNLQGIRVANPGAGVYIRHQGGIATKVIIR